MRTVNKVIFVLVAGLVGVVAADQPVGTVGSNSVNQASLAQRLEAHPVVVLGQFVELPDIGDSPFDRRDLPAVFRVEESFAGGVGEELEILVSTDTLAFPGDRVTVYAKYRPAYNDWRKMQLDFEDRLDSLTNQLERGDIDDGRYAVERAKILQARKEPLLQGARLQPFRSHDGNADRLFANDAPLSTDVDYLLAFASTNGPLTIRYRVARRNVVLRGDEARALAESLRRARE